MLVSKKNLKRKKNLPRAQTTGLVLFGPGFIITTLTVMYLVDIQPIYMNKTLVSIKKNLKKKKTYLGLKRHVWCRLGPVTIYICNKTLVSIQNHEEKLKKMLIYAQMRP